MTRLDPLPDRDAYALPPRVRPLEPLPTFDRVELVIIGLLIAAGFALEAFR